MKKVVVSAPGSTMLFGEHAVLYGGAAIACAMEARIRVEVTLRDDREVIIRSVLGDLHAHLDRLPDDPTHRFVLELLNRWRSRLMAGVEITITSDFSHKVGLGSSAALTVAVAAAFRHLCGLPSKPRALLDECLVVVRNVQGSGSGTDLVASIYGGTVLYRPDTRTITPLGEDLPIALYYCGYKTPTPEVVARVREERMMIPALYDHLYRVMNECTQQATGAVRENNLKRLGRCMNVYHGLQDALGVCDKTLADMTYDLRAKGAIGVKISGSGLGDCVVALFDPAQFEGSNAIPELEGFERLPVTVSKCGVYVESDPE
ncbi:mevalonate kinase [Parendozoicomonas haliclonae]|uniref:mevalonate kinase n=1 Tax=Parendozoicomonas haliclonae TaxID=1960125 RepID=UPI00105461E0